MVAAWTSGHDPATRSSGGKAEHEHELPAYDAMTKLNGNLLARLTEQNNRAVLALKNGGNLRIFA
jgi:hypothetical protein